MISNDEIVKGLEREGWENYKVGEPWYDKNFLYFKKVINGVTCYERVTNGNFQQTEKELKEIMNLLVELESVPKFKKMYPSGRADFSALYWFCRESAGE